MVKNLPAIQETWVQFLGEEGPLEKTMNGYPLQHSCLESPTDRGAWQASPWGRRVRHDRATDAVTFTFSAAALFTFGVMCFPCAQACAPEDF